MPYINIKQTHPLSSLIDQKCLAVTVLHPQTLPFGDGPRLEMGGPLTTVA
jgi:hypothetical protein